MKIQEPKAEFVELDLLKTSALSIEICFDDAISAPSEEYCDGPDSIASNCKKWGLTFAFGPM